MNSTRGQHKPKSVCLFVLVCVCRIDIIFHYIWPTRGLAIGIRVELGQQLDRLETLFAARHGQQ